MFGRAVRSDKLAGYDQPGSVAREQAVKSPLVFRGALERALARADALEQQVRALKEELQTLEDARDVLAGDRDRLLAAHAHSEAQRRLLQERVANAVRKLDELNLAAAAEREDGEARLAALALERDQAARRLQDFEAEAQRLGAETLRLHAALNQSAADLHTVTNDRDQALRRLGDFEAEVKRLGADWAQLREEADILSARTTDLLRERDALLAQKALLIGTFPRSGTWMLRYFLTFLDHYCETQEEADIHAISKRVQTREFLFAFGGGERHRLALSHWMCPGVFSLPEPKTAKLRNALTQLGTLEYQRVSDGAHLGFQPSLEQSRIILVYRNPFDVYRSYADLHEQRSTSPGRVPYPFNPMVPWGMELMNSESAAPFEFFISKFEESGFSEFFAAYFSSFLLVREAFPDQVAILRYEDAMRDRRAYLRAIVEFGRIGGHHDERFDAAFERAFAATDIEAMRGYERKLGHAISGEKTFYGEVNKSHLSAKKRDWRELFTPSQIAFFRERVRAIDARVLEFLPELAEPAV